MNYRIKYKNYKELLGLIAERIEGDNKKFLEKNVNKITKNLIQLSNEINKFNEIILDPFLGYNDKIAAIKKMNFSTKQAKELFKIITSVNLNGGGDTNQENNGEDNIPQLMINYTLGLPKKFLSSTGNLLINISERIKVPKLQFKDYRNSLDLIYILLFILASLPVVGLIPNLIVIIKGAMDGKYFLSMMTLYTTFLSLLYSHAFDLGAIIKLLYAIDTHSYSKYSKKTLNIKEKPVDNSKSDGELKSNSEGSNNSGQNKSEKIGGDSIFKGLYRSI